MEEAPQNGCADDSAYLELESLDDPVIGPLSYRQFTAATLGLARRLTHYDRQATEDLADDLLERLLTRLDKIPPTKAQAEAYVRKAMTHLYLSQRRKYNVRKDVLDTAEIDHAQHMPQHMVAVEDQALRFESRAALAAAIDQLTPALQEIVRATYDVERGDFRAVDRKEAAEDLDIRRNTADKRLSDALDMLYELLLPFWREEDPT
ncbi:MAG: sigma-70 family RNA polymerase sigma factor [Blastococcus sp.]|nr:sigma-70 family RNA polymerase sigma factor [Blastococcus sp.]